VLNRIDASAQAGNGGRGLSQQEQLQHSAQQFDVGSALPSSIDWWIEWLRDRLPVARLRGARFRGCQTPRVSETL